MGGNRKCLRVGIMEMFMYMVREGEREGVNKGKDKDSFYKVIDESMDGK